MKSTGIIREIDKLGRIVIPKEIRALNKINPGDGLEICVEDDMIILKKPKKGCIFCHREDFLGEYKGKPVCAICISDIKKNIVNEQ